jgi:hypothetical protein
MQINRGTLTSNELDSAIKEFLDRNYGVKDVRFIEFCHIKKAETYGRDEYEVIFVADCAKRDNP